MTLTGHSAELPLEAALASVLAGLGKPPALPAENPEVEPAARLAEALASLGLAARPVTVEAGLWPHGRCAAALLELADGFWLPLVPRPGGGYELADPEGNLRPLSDEPPAHAGRAFLLVAVDEPSLVVEVRPFLRRHAKWLVPVVVGGLISNTLALVLPLFGAFVYDKVLGNGVTDTLWAVAVGVLLAIIMDALARMFRVQLIERVAVITEGDIDRALFANLLSKAGGMPPIGLILDKYKQMLASRDFVSSVYLLALADLPFLLLFLAAIAIVAGPLVLVPIVVGGLSVAINLGLSGPARQYERLARKAGEQRVTILADVLMAREVVVTTRLRAETGRRWRRISDAAAVAGGRARFWNALSSAFTLSASSLAYATVMVGGAYLVEARLLTSGGMMAASMLTSRSMATLGSVVLLAVRLYEFRRALWELDELLPAGTEPQTEPRPTDPTGEIQLVDLTWRPRADSRPVLSGIDLRIRRGEIVGIAGLPGAGKTTLLRLIGGIERPSEGQVLLDMHPIERWDPRQLARSIGYKPQEALLFAGSIESNLRAGRTVVLAGELAAALERSGLRQAVDRGELTLATEVGPRGSHLSGGQRHMVSLARALLGDPPLLLLDEPSTGVDAQLEKNLAEYLGSLAGHRTVLVSSHSRILLSACTRIIVLNQGRVAADGPRERVLGG